MNKQNRQAYDDQFRKLQNLLLSSCRERGDEMRDLVQRLIGLPKEDRRPFVVAQWGQGVLDRVEPVLLQLEVLESQP